MRAVLCAAHLEQLGYRVQKIEDLWQQEQQQRLAEVAKDARHSNRHASKVGEGVTYKHA